MNCNHHDRVLKITMAEPEMGALQKLTAEDCILLLADNLPSRKIPIDATLSLWLHKMIYLTIIAK